MNSYYNNYFVQPQTMEKYSISIKGLHKDEAQILAMANDIIKRRKFDNCLDPNKTEYAPDGLVSYVNEVLQFKAHDMSMLEILCDFYENGTHEVLTAYQEETDTRANILNITPFVEIKTFKSSLTNDDIIIPSDTENIQQWIDKRIPRVSKLDVYSLDELIFTVIPKSKIIESAITVDIVTVNTENGINFNKFWQSATVFVRTEDLIMHGNSSYGKGTILPLNINSFFTPEDFENFNKAVIKAALKLNKNDIPTKQ